MTHDLPRPKRMSEVDDLRRINAALLAACKEAVYRFEKASLEHLEVVNQLYAAIEQAEASDPQPKGE